MKRYFIGLCGVILLGTGCGESGSNDSSAHGEDDSSTISDDSDSATDPGSVAGSCENASVPFHYCEGDNLIQYTGAATQTADMCIFASEEVVCPYVDGCIENADTDDVCWHPCLGVACDSPPDDECVDEANLNSYDPNLPITGGTCTVINSQDTEPQVQCLYVSAQVACETECISVDDGPDYCAE
ncbi:MAG: hypothetical protein JXR45_23255 [Deltaproteobacteria bacterium]|nr:hypothetical protein [Deltaproteobacteria bacterium]